MLVPIWAEILLLWINTCKFSPLLEFVPRTLAPNRGKVNALNHWANWAVYYIRYIPVRCERSEFEFHGWWNLLSSFKVIEFLLKMEPTYDRIVHFSELNWSLLVKHLVIQDIHNSWLYLWNNITKSCVTFVLYCFTNITKSCTHLQFDRIVLNF